MLKSVDSKSRPGAVKLWLVWIPATLGSLGIAVYLMFMVNGVLAWYFPGGVPNIIFYQNMYVVVILGGAVTGLAQVQVLRSVLTARLTWVAATSLGWIASAGVLVILNWVAQTTLLAEMRYRLINSILLIVSVHHFLSESVL